MSSATLKFYFTGGTVSLASPSYVKRQADEELYERLVDREFCYVLAPRQMGKSSLMARTAERLKKCGVQAAIVDLSGLGKVVDAEKWYYGVAHRIARQLDLGFNIRDRWQQHERLPGAQHLEQFLTEVVLAEVSGAIAIFVDEIDSTLGMPFASDFFALIRSCYNTRPLDSRLDRLSFVLLGVATPSQLINDPIRTPFNIGYGINLTDFTWEEAQVLARGLPFEPEGREPVLKTILHWTGGHPYLTQKLCRIVSDSGTAVASNLSEARITNIIEEHFLSPKAARSEYNLKFVRDRLTDSSQQRSSILRTYTKIGRGKQLMDVPTSSVHAALKLSGIAKVDENGFLRIRNKLYEKAFPVSWAKSELRLETPTRIAIAASSALVAVLLWFTWVGPQFFFPRTIPVRECSEVIVAGGTASQARIFDGAEKEPVALDAPLIVYDHDRIYTGPGGVLVYRVSNLTEIRLAERTSLMKRTNGQAVALYGGNVYVINRGLDMIQILTPHCSVSAGIGEFALTLQQEKTSITVRAGYLTVNTSAGRIVATENEFIEARSQEVPRLVAPERARMYSLLFGEPYSEITELELSRFGENEALQTVSPQNARILEGLRLLDNGSIVEALSMFTEVQHVQPNISTAWIASGIARMRLGKTEQGRLDLQTAVILNPGNDVARAYLSEAFRVSRDFSRAGQELILARRTGWTDGSAPRFSTSLAESYRRASLVPAALEAGGM